MAKSCATLDKRQEGEEEVVQTGDVHHHAAGIYTWLFEKFSLDGKPPGFFMKAGLGEINLLSLS